MVKFPKNPFKELYKGVDTTSQNFHRPEGAGNFDNMDDYNFVKTVNTMALTISGVPIETYLDDRYVNITGDTMTGQLDMSGNYPHIEFDSSLGDHVRIGQQAGLFTIQSTTENTLLHLDSTFSEVNTFWGTSGTTGVMRFDGTNDRFEFADDVYVDSPKTLTLAAMTTAGFVKNDATGLLTGGNSVDIGTDTNLTATSPITLSGPSGSEIGFDFSTNNTWTGTNTFNNDVTIDLSGGSLSFDESTGGMTLVLSNDAGAQGFTINKTETVRPSVTPEYFNVGVTRNWSGSAVPVNLLNYSFTDNGSATGGTDALRLFSATMSRTGGSNSVGPILDMFKISASDGQTYTGGGGDFDVFEVAGGFSPAYNTASSPTYTAAAFNVLSTLQGTNAGAGNLTENFYCINNAAAATTVTSDITFNVYGLRNVPSFLSLGGTHSCYGLYHSPTISAGTVNNYIIWAESGDIVLDADNLRVRLGETQGDFDIYHDGTLNRLSGTALFNFNQDVQVPEEAYDATTWNANVEVPTKNAIRDKIEDILDGQTFTGDIIVPDEAYGSGWNGSLEVPTKNAVYDQIESLGTGHGTSYYSLTVTEASSNTQTAEWNLFDRDNWGGGMSIDIHASSGITFVSGTGLFTVPNTGVYTISLTVHADRLTVNQSGVNIIIKNNGVDFYHEEHLENHTDLLALNTTIALTKSLTAEDDISFHMDVGSNAGGSPGTVALTGTTMSIAQIA